MRGFFLVFIIKKYMSNEVRKMINKVRDFKSILNEDKSGYLKLQRAQPGEVNDKWDFNIVNGQHGEGIYAFLYGDIPMNNYYTKNKENIHTFQIPIKYIADLSNKKWDFWDARAFIYNNPQYKAFIFKHVGPGIPSSKEVLITDPSIIQLLK